MQTSGVFVRSVCKNGVRQKWYSCASARIGSRRASAPSCEALRNVDSLFVERDVTSRERDLPRRPEIARGSIVYRGR